MVTWDGQIDMTHRVTRPLLLCMSHMVRGEHALHESRLVQAGYQIIPSAISSASPKLFPFEQRHDMLARLKASATKPGFEIPSDDATAASAPSDATAASATQPPWVLLYTTTPPMEKLEGGLSAGSAAGHREVAMGVERSLSTMPDEITDMTIAMDVERCMVAPAASPLKRSFNHRDVHEEMTEIFHDVYQRHGGNRSEAQYQRAVARSAYLRGLPTMQQRDLYADRGEGIFLVGRIDIEVAGSCLYEFKATRPNLDKDSLQLRTYLNSYDETPGEELRVAALVYFTPTSGVVVHVMRGH